MDSTDRLAQLLFESGQLARTPRSGYALLRSGKQNVAEHAHRTALVAYVLVKMANAKKANAIDEARVLAMALLHDLPETRTTDLNHFTKRYLDPDTDAVLADQTKDTACGAEIRDLINEFERTDSPESRLVRDADYLELLLTLREQQADGATKASEWIAKTLSRLQTDVGRQLGETIVRVDPDQWWRT